MAPIIFAALALAGTLTVPHLIDIVLHLADIELGSGNLRLTLLIGGIIASGCR